MRGRQGRGGRAGKGAGTRAGRARARERGPGRDARVEEINTPGCCAGLSRCPEMPDPSRPGPIDDDRLFAKKFFGDTLSHHEAGALRREASPAISEAKRRARECSCAR